MNSIAFMGMLICGVAFWILPLVLPLFFCLNVQRKGLFYFVGLSCSFVCYKVAPMVWGFSCVFLGHILASIRHEDFQKAIEYSFALAVPGLNEGYFFMGLLPALILGTLLSVLVLRKLKSSLFKATISPSNSDKVDSSTGLGGTELSDGYRSPL